MPKKNARKARTKAKPRRKPGGPRIIDLRQLGQLDDVGGRPTKYRPDYARIAEQMAANGSTDAEIARAFGIAPATLYRWKADIPEFRESIAGAKQIPIARVERSLYHRAVGYEHDHDEIRANGKAVTVVKTVKHYPPDTSAARLWLNNVAPERWRPRRDPEPPPPSEATSSPAEELTDEEIDVKLARIEANRQARAAAAAGVRPKKRARK